MRRQHRRFRAVVQAVVLADDPVANEPGQGPQLRRRGQAHTVAETIEGHVRVEFERHDYAAGEAYGFQPATHRLRLPVPTTTENPVDIPSSRVLLLGFRSRTHERSQRARRQGHARWPAREHIVGPLRRRLASPPGRVKSKASELFGRHADQRVHGRTDALCEHIEQL